jgi:hypothetical protein
MREEWVRLGCGPGGRGEEDGQRSGKRSGKRLGDGKRQEWIWIEVERPNERVPEEAGQDAYSTRSVRTELPSPSV